MFSEELQRLIDASLVDGVITDKERAVIHKRALQEGIDLDEIDVMLDAEIHKITQKQQSSVSNVKKCPNCGEIIPAMAIRCPSCQYELRDIEANKSISKLFEQLRKVSITNGSEESLEDKKREIINSFPIPNTKEDIFEFLSMAMPNAKRKGGMLSYGSGRFIISFFPIVLLSVFIFISFYDGKHVGGEILAVILLLTFGLLFCWGYSLSEPKSMEQHNKFSDVWKVKCEQIIMKARYTMSSDKKIMDKIKEYEDQNRKTTLSTIAQFSIFIVLCLFVLYFIGQHY